MNRTLVIAEWKRAKCSLRAASLCLYRRCHADATSRAYYAVFHAAKAALIYSSGTAPQSHGYVKQQFGFQLVKNGPIEGYWGSEIGNLYDLRLRADYDAQANFTAAYVRDACQRAERFLERILRLLVPVIAYADLA